ncbi:hypothetical protein [Salinisphaera sp. RV14]|uniref:hypothetical protein n=2 Tax=unclassified Salinisphaera TaxID=2649847 RepID=UPI003F845286
MQQESLGDLVSTHHRLAYADDRCICSPCYAFDTERYLLPTARYLDCQMLAKSVLRGWRTDQQAIDAVYDIAQDRALLNDYYAIATQDAYEQAVATMATVCAEHLPASWPANPVAFNGMLRLSRDNAMAMHVDAMLERASASMNTNRSGALAPAMTESLARISQLLYAVDKAFNAAAIVLLSFNIERHIAGLMRNEAMAILMEG